MSAKVNPSKRRAAALSVGSNVFLVLGKLVVGLLTRSVAVISEAIHSAMDLLAAIIALVAVSYSDRPPDESHPHGHGKIENLSGAIEALLIIGAVFFIAFESIEKLIHGGKVEQVYLGAIVMGVSALVNTFVSWRLQQVGKRTDSEALLADAAHLRTDVYTSIGVFAGLLLVHFTGKHWLDPVSALSVALLIVWEAWQITRRSVGQLLDESLPEEEQEVVRRVVVGQGATCHALRSRKSGSTRKFDFHLDVSPRATVDEVHALCDAIKEEVRRQLPGSQILIHPEPTAPPSTGTLKQRVADMLAHHHELFVAHRDLRTCEAGDGPHVLFRLQLRPDQTVSAVEQVCAHLSLHIREISPAAQIYIQPVAGEAPAVPAPAAASEATR